MNPVNWSRPVNWNHSLNKTLTGWWLNVPHWQGGTMLRDLTGRRHGVLTGMTTSDWIGPSGRRGGWGALDFDGGNDYINFATFPSFVGNFCISIWANMQPGITVNRSLISRQASNYKGWNLWIDSDTQAGAPELNYQGDSGVGGKITGPTDLRDGKWHHILFNKIGNDRTDWELYVDGIKQSVTEGNSDTSGDHLTVTPMRIAARLPTATSFIAAKIDDVRLYNRELKASEAMDLYRLSSNFQGDLLNRVSVQAKAPSIDTGFPLLMGANF